MKPSRLSRIHGIQQIGEMVIAGILLAGCHSVVDQPVSSSSVYWGRGIEGEAPRQGLTLLNLTAVQQTTDYTCGPAAVLSLLRFYGRDGDEMQLARQMGTNDKVGTTPENMAKWLQKNGFIVNWGEHGSLGMLQENLTKHIPTLVEWSDWGGHWAIVIGYDTRNTANPDDDVIIFADPYDAHDDRPDGISWFNAQRFDYMWYDALLFGRLMEKVFITAIPGSPQDRTTLQ